ncbi:MAG: 2-hydroxyglutaryl-CoA dehydratase [Deltaproteobacteria bacterium]|nr:2-hydroxyglutaryl-CoA dehydratase [Deltaproteobacteria bacterium]
MSVAGVDIGAGTAKAVILQDDLIVSHAVVPVRSDVIKAAERVMENALDQAGLSMASLDYVVSTGYGRDAVSFNDNATTEIICHALGVHFLIPQARTIIDIGAQDSKMIRVNGSGNVTDFVMNDKCAAGTGRFLEVMAQVLGLKIEEMGPKSLTSKKRCEISSTCTVFAETEVVSLRAKGQATEDLIAGIHRAISSRVLTMGSGIRLEPEIVFTGGVAKNSGVKSALEEGCKVKFLVPEEPQITGALGAALFAQEKLGSS